MSKLKNKFWQWFGVVAMTTLHLSTLPVIVRVLAGDFNSLPPFDYIVMIYIGLLMMAIRYHYFIQDKLAVISNLIGVYANLFIISSIIYFGA